MEIIIARKVLTIPLIKVNDVLKRNGIRLEVIPVI
jgi:hypothetical protein